ncbi:hypothetical protein NE237_014648 [Protea cynaroides]|uniref:Uncharacterized protein n=1 Tax=Protea cynaroides TaxID=273540 RepID=A0A9Q0QQA0_9MAGN|nr:hypothetical protein NE237_014648 [Protea cynaroides]
MPLVPPPPTLEQEQYGIGTKGDELVGLLRDVPMSGDVSFLQSYDEEQEQNGIATEEDELVGVLRDVSMSGDASLLQSFDEGRHCEEGTHQDSWLMSSQCIIIIRN